MRKFTPAFAAIVAASMASSAFAGADMDAPMVPPSSLGEPEFTPLGGVMRFQFEMENGVAVCKAYSEPLTDVGGVNAAARSVPSPGAGALFALAGAAAMRRRRTRA